MMCNLYTVKYTISGNRMHTLKIRDSITNLRKEGPVYDCEETNYRLKEEEEKEEDYLDYYTNWFI